MSQKGYYETTTGDLLTAGPSTIDYVNDGSYNASLHTIRSDVPVPAKVRGDSSETNMNNWNGSAWVEVAQPTPQGYEVIGSGTIVLDLDGKAFAHKRIVATGDVTIQLKNQEGIDIFCLETKQDATGGHTFTFDTTYFETNSPGQSSAANKKDTWMFGCNDENKLHQHSIELDVS